MNTNTLFMNNMTGMSLLVRGGTTEKKDRKSFRSTRYASRRLLVRFRVLSLPLRYVLAWLVPDTHYYLSSKDGRERKKNEN